jgi:hypothetical protein
MLHIDRNFLSRILKPLAVIVKSIRSSAAAAKERRVSLLKRRSVGSVIGAVAVLLLAWLTVGVGSFAAGFRLQASLVLLVGVIIGIIVITTPRERYVPIFINHFGWIPVSIGALSYWYWHWYASGQPISESFFDTAAQILPVFLLAAILDVRRSTTLKSSQLALPIIGVFLGEIAALSESAFAGIEDQSNKVDDFAIVASSLVIAIAALVMAVLADLEESK